MLKMLTQARHWVTVASLVFNVLSLPATAANDFIPISRIGHQQSEIETVVVGVDQAKRGAQSNEPTFSPL